MTATATAIKAILHNRAQGHRDSTYAMLMQLINDMPACLRTLEQMAIERIGCWRDVRGFIRHFEQHGAAHAATTECTVALIAGCVSMTNAQIRQGCAWAAKWVPREPKCRGSPLLQWYYDELAADLFPGVPDAKRRYRKLVSALSPPPTANPASPTLVWLVKQAERAQAERVQEINALWHKHQRQHQRQHQRHESMIPLLSLAQSMGPGHNNCLHAGIGLALHVAAMSSCSRIITFSSHAQWHELETHDDFVSNVQFLLCAARSPTNGLNANLGSALNVAAPARTLLIISDMEHDDAFTHAPHWNVAQNRNCNINYIMSCISGATKPTH